MTFKAKLFNVLTTAVELSIDGIEVEALHYMGENALTIDLADEAQINANNQDVEVDKDGNFEFQAEIDGEFSELSGCAMMHCPITAEDLKI